MEERFSLLLPLSLLLLFLLFEELYFPSSFFILSRFLPLLLNPLFFFFSSSLRLSTQLKIYYFTLLDIGGPFKRFFNTFLACCRRRLSVDLWTFLWERGPSGEKESRLGESSVWMLRLWALGLRSEGWELRGWEECPRLRVCLRRLVTVCNLVLRMVVNMDSFRDCSRDYSSSMFLIQYKLYLMRLSSGINS
jgi:hypothetical protein